MQPLALWLQLLPCFPAKALLLLPNHKLQQVERTLLVAPTVALRWMSTPCIDRCLGSIAPESIVALNVAPVFNVGPLEPTFFFLLLLLLLIQAPTCGEGCFSSYKAALALL
jgi:hypothetical protein